MKILVENFDKDAIGNRQAQKKLRQLTNSLLEMEVVSSLAQSKSKGEEEEWLLGSEKIEKYGNDIPRFVKDVEDTFVRFSRTKSKASEIGKASHMFLNLFEHIFWSSL